MYSDLGGIKLLLSERFNLSKQVGSLGHHLALLQWRHVEPGSDAEVAGIDKEKNRGGT